jgi:16S rRNA C967 or C1407 C5-methylase (RsmB/RsmF family)
VDEYTEDEVLETSEQEAPAAIDDKYVRKLKDENHSLRQRLRRTELEVNFGKDVVELIPEELPLAKWEEFAGRLAERMPKPAPPEQTEPEASTEEPAQEAEPAGLAAVTNAPAPGTAVPGELLTVKEIKELGKTDPVRATELISQGKFKPAEPW